jgi:hypothetical protein
MQKSAPPANLAENLIDFSIDPFRDGPPYYAHSAACVDTVFASDMLASKQAACDSGSSIQYPEKKRKRHTRSDIFW